MSECKDHHWTQTGVCARCGIEAVEVIHILQGDLEKAKKDLATAREEIDDLHSLIAESNSKAKGKPGRPKRKDYRSKTSEILALRIKGQSWGQISKLMRIPATSCSRLLRELKAVEK